MADVSKIKTIDNNTYDIKDAAAREALDTKQPLITTENKVPYSLISGTPTIPSKTSDLTNDSDYVANAVVPSIAYCTCSTAAATAAKIATVTSTTKFELTKGTIIAVKFSKTNSATNVTLNVNNTGAKQLYYNDAVYTSSSSSIGGYANRHIYYMYDGTYWVWLNFGTLVSDTVPSAYCTSSASTTAKTATFSDYALKANAYCQIVVKSSNSVLGAITLNINGRGAKPIYINGEPSSATNYTLPAGTYIIYYDGTNYYFRTDGTIEGIQPKLTAGSGITISGNTISATASGGITDVKQNGTSVVTSGVANVTVPTKTSDITNDSGFITNSYHDSTKVDEYTLRLTAWSGGIPKQVKFLSVDYNDTGTDNAVFINLKAISCQPNGRSYKFMEEIIIGVDLNGNIGCDVKKTIKTSCGTFDGQERYYGDVFYTVDTTSKVVDFFMLGGAYSEYRFTPYKRRNSAVGGIITQYSGAGTFYESGNKVYGNNALILTETDIKTVNNQSLIGSGNIQIDVPTKTSQLTNDSGFLTSHQSLSAYRTAAAQDTIDNGKQDKITSSNKLSYSLLSDTPTIPTKTSQLTNNSGFLTSHQDISGKANINGINTFSKPQKIVGKDSDDGSSQSALLKVLNTQTSTTGTTEWRGRIMCGAENKTFLLGTYNGLCGLGAHSWTSAASGTGASWEPVYIQPDGTQPVYIGANGVGWTSGSGALKVTGSNTAGAATVDVNGTLRINGSNVADYVVEQGVSSGWQYKKWNSGRAECWGVTAESCAITVSQGNCYRTNGIVLNLAFPFTFKSTPKCYVTLSSANTGLWVSGLPSLSTTATGGVFVFRPSSGTYTVTANYYAEGSWK